jgi:3-polyprenyl-4-hydroxybenzoate decarboxylase
MFDCIKGYTIPLVVGILGGSREIYATALETDQAGLWEKWARANNPIPPQLVSNGPCQEVVHMGEEADLEMLPAPVWTVGQDPGPYHTSPFPRPGDARPQRGNLSGSSQRPPQGRNDDQSARRHAAAHPEK